MKPFFEALTERVKEVDSLLCIGLDPTPGDLPHQDVSGLRDFCLRLVAATAPFAAAFKPNSAFFEAFGAAGLSVLQEVIAAIPQEIPVILDAKRGDIASTAQAYARAAFDVLKAGAVTVNPYLGYDALAPFIEDARHGVFLLCKTSNPGAADLQDLLLKTPPADLPATFPPGTFTLYEQVAFLATRWNRKANLGLVVGATQPQALGRVRQIAPDLWILAPGLGAQGGDLRAALNAGLRSDGMGLLFPVSRAIASAPDPGSAAASLKDEINRVRAEFVISSTTQAGTSIPGGISPKAGHLADRLLATGCVKFAEPDKPFVLKSGLQSPIYIDLRQVISFPDLLEEIAAAYLPILRSLSFQRLAALPYAAIPIATAISLQSGWPLVYPRKEVKAYGTQAEIEGLYSPGERLVIIDDLATTGGSKFEAIARLKNAGLEVSDIVVLIDRQSGAAEALAGAGFRLHAVFTLTGMLDHWQQAGAISPEKIASVCAFLKSSKARQDNPAGDT